MKNLCLISFLLLFFCSAASAQCTSGDCRNGFGTYIYPSGARYVGQFQDGKIFGNGTCYFKDGSIYQGEWENGKPNGKGIKTFKDGRKLSGVWKKGALVRETGGSEKGKSRNGSEEQAGCISGDCKNGQGMYIYPSGAIYNGEFKNGEINGTGVCQYSDGSSYRGSWKNRYPDGIGTRTYADGTVRVGLWKQGQPVDEEGNILDAWVEEDNLFSEGFDIQSGCISGDCTNGRGTFAYPNGDKYEGKFANGKPNGSGIYSYLNGEKYIGIFRDGLSHGKGKVYKDNSIIQEGVWVEGEYVGMPHRELPKEGCTDGDCIDGFGTFIFRSGAKYTGTFNNGQPEGQGTMTYTNGEKYSGDWVSGKYEGEGTLYIHNGSKVSGYWREGVYAGKERRPTVIRPEPGFERNRLSKHQPNLKVWAVIVGVASYNHMPLLRYTDDDAYRMFALLEKPGRWCFG